MCVTYFPSNGHVLNISKGEFMKIILFSMLIFSSLSALATISIDTSEFEINFEKVNSHAQVSHIEVEVNSGCLKNKRSGFSWEWNSLGTKYDEVECETTGVLPKVVKVEDGRFRVTAANFQTKSAKNKRLFYQITINKQPYIDFTTNDNPAWMNTHEVLDRQITELSRSFYVLGIPNDQKLTIRSFLDLNGESINISKLKSSDENMNIESVSVSPSLRGFAFQSLGYPYGFNYAEFADNCGPQETLKEVAIAGQKAIKVSNQCRITIISKEDPREKGMSYNIRVNGRVFDKYMTSNIINIPISDFETMALTSNPELLNFRVDSNNPIY